MITRIENDTDKILLHNIMFILGNGFFVKYYKKYSNEIIATYISQGHSQSKLGTTGLKKALNIT